MSHQQPTSGNAAAETMNGFPDLYPRRVSPTTTIVLSLRSDDPTAYEVDVVDLECDCKDHVMNKSDPTVCDHIGAALYQAPAELSLDEALLTDLTMILSDLEDAAEQAEDAAGALEGDLVAQRDAEAGAAAQESEPEPTEPAEPRVTVGDVDDWLQAGFAKPGLVEVRDGSHDGVDGIQLEPDNQAMADHVYESFKGLVNSLDDSTAHVGFLDEPCGTCGLQDGEFYYHVPADDGSEVWS